MRFAKIATLLATLVIVGVCSTRATSAWADAPDPEKRAAAQALFDQAKELTDQRRFSEACPKLLESYKLDPAMGTKFYLARCYESVGKLASAWAYYLEVVDDAHKAGALDREKFANDRAASLKPRLPRLSVTPSPDARATSGLVLKRDGIVVGEGSWDTPIPVDLGVHVITASAPGHVAWEARIEAKEEGASLRLEVPALRTEPAPSGPVAPRPDAPAAPPPEPPVSRWSTKQGLAGLVLGGVGVAGLVGGAIAGGVAVSKQHASNTGGCNAADACTAAGRALRDDAIQAATASTALFVIGGTAAAVGGVLILTAPSGKLSTTTGSFVLQPTGISFAGRF